MAYLYRHIRLDKNEPFYIGISSDTGYRAKDVKKRNSLWKGIVSRTNYKIEIVMNDLSWEEICKKEIEFIKLYGRICDGSGCLVNLSAGGEGYLNPSLEVRNKLSISKQGPNNPNFGKKITKETSIKLINSATGRIVSKETREKISSAQKGKPRNMSGIKKYQDEIKRTGVNPLSGIKRSEETKLKISNAKLGVKFTALHKQNISSSKKGIPSPLKGKKGRKLSLEAIERRKLRKTKIKLSENAKLKISNALKGKPKSNSIKVIDTVTLKIYDSITIAASDINISNLYLHKMLKGTRKNITTLKILTDANI